MSGHDFYKAISERTGIAQDDIHIILRAAGDVIYDSLNEDKNERITFGNLGFFKVKHVKEHKSVSNLEGFKGTAYITPEHDEIMFSPFINRRDLDSDPDNGAGD